MIDRETVDKILNAADIVDVVSDFVHLRRRGANYIGLCPFHNEKTPSFSVSRSKGICKCFSCGKGGSPVNFIMEHEQMSYYEALKYLAKKYNIEIKERELTDQEKQVQSERENMLLINEFALKHFEENLFNTEEGRTIGLSYFYERGFNDNIIKKFHLGYSIDSKTDLNESIKRKGFNVHFAIEAGLCIKGEHGVYDRFKGRVMFPVLNIAGKVIAFGGRTLKKDHAKYVNSPESVVYKKSNELYGLYQAKQAIVKKDQCFLVEGYTDVLSMHQAGIENVVASSGTSLTEGQIRMIHRFTDNITVLYDGDAAGIKASLRGIDLLLSENLNVKVLLLPDGDDPDSYAKKHSATEFQNYILKNETDFIRFKTRILLDGIDGDPIKKAAAIQDIVKSIAVIPSEITRSIYVKECSSSFGIDEKILLNEVAKSIAAEKEKKPISSWSEKKASSSTIVEPENKESNRSLSSSVSDKMVNLIPFEQEVIRYIAKYGMCVFCDALDETGNKSNLLVLEYIYAELENDAMSFSCKAFQKIYERALSLLPEYQSDIQRKQAEFLEYSRQMQQEGINRIRLAVNNIEEIKKEEQLLNERIQADIAQMQTNYQMNYLEKRLCSDPDDIIRNATIGLVSEKYQLSKLHTKISKIDSEYERLDELVPMAILGWKDAILSYRIKDIQEQIKQAGRNSDFALMETLMTQQNELIVFRSQLAKVLGDRVIVPL